MAHRRVKDVSYDEEDYDDYEEEEYGATDSGTTAEDQARMRQGTEAVLDALGADSTVTAKEIEEALWYYYYDIEKTIAYLKSTSESGREFAKQKMQKADMLAEQQAPQQPKAQKQKQQSKFDQAANAAQSKATTTGYGESYSLLYTL